MERNTRFHKGATSAETKTLAMPIVAPQEGVTEARWAQEWLQARIDLKASDKPGAVVRAPASSGSLMERPCTSREITRALRLALEVDEESGISGHSLKGATLAWSAKYGMPEEIRETLGHHRSSRRSMAIYARDLLAEPMRMYTRMLGKIRSGRFKPDASRSGWLPCDESEEQQGAGEEQQSFGQVRLPSDEPPWEDDALSVSLPSAFPMGRNVFEEDEEERDFAPSSVAPAEAEEPDVSSSSSSSSEDESDASGANEERLLQEHGVAAAAGDEPCFQHKKSRMLHKPGATAGRAACGRALGDGYTRLARVALQWPRCSGCWRDELISTRAQLVEALGRMKNA